MMRSAAGLGFALVVSGTAGCGNETIPIAMVNDASVDAGAVACAVGGTGLDGGSGCQEGQFCETRSCGATAGFCTEIHGEPCDSTSYSPECGCDGVSYFNSCVRRAASISATSETTCDNQATVKTRSCDSALPLFPSCPNGSNGCAVIVPNSVVVPFEVADASISSVCNIPQIANAGICWVLPDCPSSGALHLRSCGVSRCIDACSAMRTGGPLIPCDPGDPSDD